MVNNYSFYAPTNVAIGGERITQNIAPPGPGDEEGLLRYLAAGGVAESDFETLRQALDEDRAQGEDDQSPTRWQRTRAWFALAATDVAANAVGGLIAAAAAGFFPHG